VLAICTLSLFIVGLNITAVNVALPTIGRDLHADVSGLQWTVDAYTLVLASLLMLAGSTGDWLGRKRVFVTGLAVFSVASLLCSLAPDVELLVAFRVLQAVGGSMLNPVAMSIVANAFTDPRERAQAVGSGARCSASRWRSVRSWAVRSSPPSAGARSSGSTCRWGWPRSR
jgi:MFS family permease